MSALGHCGELVRRHDYDRFLCTLFAPAAVRPHLFALYAFNYEIARVGETVSESMLGEIRLAWWRETIRDIFAGTVRAHPVAEALAAAIQSAGLPQASFDRIIEARTADLAPAPFSDLAAFEAYADATSSELMGMAALACGLTADAMSFVRPAGIAFAFTGQLRARKVNAGLGRTMLPPVSTPVLLDWSRQRLTEATQAWTRSWQVALPAFLPVTIARAHLKALSRLHGDEVGPEASRLTVQLRVLWASLRGRP